jgi:hypothetical protein
MACFHRPVQAECEKEVGASPRLGAADYSLFDRRRYRYFGDGDLSTLPKDLQRLAAAATAVDLDTLPVLHLLGKCS